MQMKDCLDCLEANLTFTRRIFQCNFGRKSGKKMLGARYRTCLVSAKFAQTIQVIALKSRQNVLRFDQQS